MDDPLIETIKRGVARYTGLAPDDLRLDHRFEDLGIDSLDAVGIIADLEDELGVAVPNEELRSLGTVADAVAVIRRARGEAEAAAG